MGGWLSGAEGSRGLLIEALVGARLLLGPGGPARVGKATPDVPPAVLAGCARASCGDRWALAGGG